jgi:hypothetical protein
MSPAWEDYGPLTKGLSVVVTLVQLYCAYLVLSCLWDGQWVGAVRALFVLVGMGVAETTWKKLLGFL